MSLIVSITII